jgi:hypothetical protein
MNDLPTSKPKSLGIPDWFEEQFCFNSLWELSEFQALVAQIWNTP